MLMKLNMHPKWQVTHAHCIINQAGPSGDSSFLATFSFTVCRPWTNQLATDDANVGIRTYNTNVVPIDSGNGTGAV